MENKNLTKAQEKKIGELRRDGYRIINIAVYGPEKRAYIHVDFKGIETIREYGRRGKLYQVTGVSRQSLWK